MAFLNSVGRLLSNSIPKFGAPNITTRFCPKLEKSDIPIYVHVLNFDFVTMGLPADNSMLRLYAHFVGARHSQIYTT